MYIFCKDKLTTIQQQLGPQTIMSDVQCSNSQSLLQQHSPQPCSFYSIPNRDSSSFLVQSLIQQDHQSPTSQQSQFVSILRMSSSTSAFSLLNEQIHGGTSHAELSNNSNTHQQPVNQKMNDSSENQPEIAKVLIQEQHKESYKKKQTNKCDLQAGENFSNSGLLQLEDLIQSENQYEDSQYEQEQSDSQYEMQSDTQSESQFQSHRKTTRKSIKKFVSKTSKSCTNSRNSFPRQSTESSTELDNQSSKEFISSSRNKKSLKSHIQKAPKQKPIKKSKHQKQRHKPNSQHYSVFNSIQNYFN